MSARLFLAILVLATEVSGQETEKWHPLCPPQSGRNHPVTFSRSAGALTISVGFTPEKDLSGDAQSCRFRLISSSGATVVRGTGDFLGEPELVDVDGDGLSEIVLTTGDSGTAHCGALYIVKQRPAQLLKRLENCSSPAIVNFAQQPQPLIVMRDPTFWTEDQHFIPFMCHICSPTPSVYFRLENGKLRNVSGEMSAAYDRDIADERSRLGRANLKALVAARDLHEIDLVSRTDANRLGDTLFTVLRIVTDYLYSGRQQQAWRALDDMWPAWDRERIQRWLLKRIAESRRRGTLAFENR